jgi:Transposase
MDTTVAPLASIGVDIGKEVFHLVGFGTDGKIAFRSKIKRLALIETFKKLPPCVVGMEACLSAHFVSRALRQLGHEPRIIPAIYVKPFVKGQKNDYNDAEAIAEASLRPNLRTVCEKSQEQLDPLTPQAFTVLRVVPAQHRLDNRCRAGRNTKSYLNPFDPGTLNSPVGSGARHEPVTSHKRIFCGRRAGGSCHHIDRLRQSWSCDRCACRRLDQPENSFRQGRGYAP